MIDAKTLKFLRDLAKNNQKAWFDEHRDEYDHARQNYAGVVSRLIDKLSVIDPEIKDIEASKAIFRQNRDIRFSKNKTPYKTNFGASIKKGGKKSPFAGYYFHIEPGGRSFAGGGLWMPEAESLRKIRQEIDYNLEEFTAIIQAKAFVKHYGSLESTPETMLVNLPRGYQKDNAAGSYLKYKSIIATRMLEDSELTKPGLVKSIEASFKALEPLISFLNRGIE